MHALAKHLIAIHYQGLFEPVSSSWTWTSMEESTEEPDEVITHASIENEESEAENVSSESFSSCECVWISAGL